MDVYPGLGQRGVHRGAEITSQTFRQSKEQSGLKKIEEKKRIYMWTVKSQNSWENNPEVAWEGTSVGSALGRHQLPSEGPHSPINLHGRAACLLP